MTMETWGWTVLGGICSSLIVAWLFYKKQADDSKMLYEKKIKEKKEDQCHEVLTEIRVGLMKFRDTLPHAEIEPPRDKHVFLYEPITLIKDNACKLSNTEYSELGNELIGFVADKMQYGLFLAKMNDQEKKAEKQKLTDRIHTFIDKVDNALGS